MGSRRRRTAVVASLAVVVAAAIATVALSSGSPTRTNAGTGEGVPAGDVTTTVTRRTLTESSTVDGTLGYGATQELYDRLPGTFTWLPSAGATIARGGTLFRLDNLPVVLMYGSVPAYRALKEGVGDGPDVAELNRNLIVLGYDTDGAIADDSHYGEATAAAVRRWQHVEGLPETGEVQLGRIVFAPSARRIAAVHVALGQDPPGATEEGKEEGEPSMQAGEPSKEDGEPSMQAGEPSKEDGEPSKEDDGEPSNDKPSKEGSDKEGSKPKAGKHPSDKSGSAENPASKESPSKASKESPSKGPGKESSTKEPHGEDSRPEGGGEGSKPEGGSGAGTLVLTTTSTQQLVQLKLKAEQQQLARVGERAPVTLPGGEVVPGTIIGVGTVASEAKSGENEKGGGGGGGGSPGSEGGGESATIPVTLALAHRVARLDQAPVSVELVKSVRRNVLAVPATALLAVGGGSYAIEVLEGDRRTQLPVTPGMFAGGYVQVEGSGLSEGQTVIESE